MTLRYNRRPKKHKGHKKFPKKRKKEIDKEAVKDYHLEKKNFGVSKASSKRKSVHGKLCK